MQTVSCPSCGAEVQFRSAASVLAVCEYCQSTLLKDADSVKDIGKMAEALEDYSPIQLGTCGSYKALQFSVVGRIQLRYEHGLWNEWYLLFNDGSAGWLSDASGQYVLTQADGPALNAPQFDTLIPGAPYLAGETTLLASDIRTARCVAGQGELPFQVGQGWQAQVADFRRGRQFVTLDYSDGYPPQRYQGQAVELADLKCQLLRSDDDIIASAGKYRGKAAALDCPSCGAAIGYQPGITYHLLCPSCHAEVECSTGQALVLQKHAELQQQKTTLELGSVASIGGVKYRLIGLMRCRDEEDSWTEYLLFHASRGFLWLVESAQGWQRVTVLNSWPDSVSAKQAEYDGQKYAKRYDYQSEVTYAAGAFNWHVTIGDRTSICDYQCGTSVLTAETSEHETTWSLAKPVDAHMLAEWFKRPELVKEAAKPLDSEAQLRSTAIWLSAVLVLLNLPMLFLGSFFETLLTSLFGLMFLWLPVLHGKSEKG